MIATGFTGATIDRADALRNDPAALASAAKDPASRLLRLDGLDPVVAGDRLCWDGLSGVRSDDTLILLGRCGGEARFVACRATLEPVAGRPAGLMDLLATLPRDEMALYAAARSLVDWHARHRFCARCGSRTDPDKGGWARTCPACSAQHFPRTDPVVIMLAQHRDRVLLGRGPGWGPGRYSALAGFVEPGESIEEAVARETFEEAGVRVTDVRYVASQPWPFPSSLMIACIADAADDALTIDETELEDAFWASRDEVAAAMTGAPHVRFVAPPRYAIAHSLLAAWLG